MNTFAIESKLYLPESSQTGFITYAEKLDGRLAMIGFVSLVVLTGYGLIGTLATALKSCREFCKQMVNR